MTATSSNPARECQPGTASLWQPIDSAPKDGTPILCFVPDLMFSAITGMDVIYWEGGEGGCWNCYGERFAGKPPTHWQPLPPPPEAI